MSEFISRNSLPAPTRGKGASTSPSVTISEMGGVRINSFIKAKCVDTLGIHLGWDEATRKATFTALNVLPKGVTKEDLFEVVMAKKSNQASIGGLTPFLRMKEYDFKASGNQNFVPVVNETKAGYQFVITLPKGSLTPPPKQVRKPRAAKAPATAPQVEQSVADLV